MLELSEEFGVINRRYEPEFKRTLKQLHDFFIDYYLVSDDVIKDCLRLTYLSFGISIEPPYCIPFISEYLEGDIDLIDFLKSGAFINGEFLLGRYFYDLHRSIEEQFRICPGVDYFSAMSHYHSEVFYELLSRLELSFLKLFNLL